jgi:hypothetical protein
VIKKLIQKNSEVLLSIPWPKECAIVIYYWKGNRKHTMPVWASTTSDLTRLDLATLIRWLHSCSLPIHVSLDILKLSLLPKQFLGSWATSMWCIQWRSKWKWFNLKQRSHKLGFDMLVHIETLQTGGPLQSGSNNFQH